MPDDTGDGDAQSLPPNPDSLLPLYPPGLSHGGDRCTSCAAGLCTGSLAVLGLRPCAAECIPDDRWPASAPDTKAGEGQGLWLAELLAAVLVRAAEVGPAAAPQPAPEAWDTAWAAFFPLLARHLEMLQVHWSAAQEQYCCGQRICLRWALSGHLHMDPIGSPG